MTNILIGILEDNPARVARLTEALATHGVTARVVDHDNAPDFLTWLEDEPAAISLVSLDHDLIESGRFEDHGTGSDVVRVLCGRAASFPVVVHASSSDKRRAMAAALVDAGWRAEAADASADQSAWARTVKRMLA